MSNFKRYNPNSTMEVTESYKLGDEKFIFFYDTELYNLMDYVKTLLVVDDIRIVNEQTFHLKNFYDDYVNEFLQV